MPRRNVGRPKLNAAIQAKLVQAATDSRRLIYGEQGCPDWGTSFAEIEADAKEVGHEFIRLLMEQSAGEQREIMPESALTTDAGETAQRIGDEQRKMETESGPVTWAEPRAYLPKSRKAFFPSDQSAGLGS
jgi:hypothetical protein